MLIIMASPNSLLKDGKPLAEIVEVLKEVREAGSPVGLISNNDQPDWFDDFFSESGVQFIHHAGRQNGWIVAQNAKKFDLDPFNVLVLASKSEDVQMGKNGGAVLVAAGWGNLRKDVDALGIKVQSADELAQIVRLTEGWPGGWWWSADAKDYSIRALADLSTFGKDHTQAQFRDGIRSTVKGGGVRLNALLAVVARSLLREGVSEKNNLLFGVYPSSSSSNLDDEVLSDFTHRLRTTVSRVRMASRGKPLFIRHRPSIKRHASHGGIDRTDPTDQITSLHLNPEYKGKIDNRNVVLVDDCATYGVSFGVASAFLKAAGATSVTCVALGKFGGQLRHYPITINGDPFSPITSKEEFTVGKVLYFCGTSDAGSQHVLQSLIG